jgi:hypothetical protein
MLSSFAGSRIVTICRLALSLMLPLIMAHLMLPLIMVVVISLLLLVVMLPCRLFLSPVVLGLDLLSARMYLAITHLNRLLMSTSL